MGMARVSWVGVCALSIAAAACGGDDDSGKGSGGNAGAAGAAGAGGASSGGASSGGNAGAAGSGLTAGSGAGGSAGSSGSGTGGAGTGGAGTGGAGTGGAGTGGAATGGSGGNVDIPSGGTILFQEKFDDAGFTARGWYDGSQGTISTAEKAPGSSSSYQCAFASGATTCTNGKPARHKFTPSESVYASFWLKFSPNWVGSGKAYHPHMFHFINDKDSDYVGPASSFLTTYMEVVNGKAFLGLQDSKNVDTSCILRNNDTFVGCNGNFNTYVFTENRSVCACNGLLGDLDGRDCFSTGASSWYSARSWTKDNAFVNAAGPNYKADWHFVEVYFEMNSIVAGKGVADGKLRWVQDGVTLIKYDKILMRTGANPTLKFKQFAMLPYIGDGSPVAQSYWVDDLTVATKKP